MIMRYELSEHQTYCPFLMFQMHISQQYTQRLDPKSSTSFSDQYNLVCMLMFFNQEIAAKYFKVRVVCPCVLCSREFKLVDLLIFTDKNT